MSIDNSFQPSTTAPAFDVYTAALSIDPQNVVPNNAHCDNCFNDVSTEMKLFSCRHSICQACLEVQPPGNSLYSTVFGQNQLCPICSLDSKPIVNGNNFLSNGNPMMPNGNSLPPPPNGNPLAYIPMNIYPPPPPGSDPSKIPSMDPFASLIYQQPMPPPPHMNGNHLNSFQGFNGNHPSMKVHNTNNGPTSPSLASTINNQITSTISDQTHVHTTSPHYMVPQPVNSKQQTHSLPTTMPNHMPISMHNNFTNNLPPNFPPNFPPIPNFPNIFPPLPPNLQNSFPPPPPLVTNFQSNFSIPKPQNLSPVVTTPNLPENSPIPLQSPKISNITGIPVTPTTPAAVTSTTTTATTSRTSSSLGSSEASSLTNSINSVLCSCDEGVSATAQCIDCEDYLCESCVRAHRKVRWVDY